MSVPVPIQNNLPLLERAARTWESQCGVWIGLACSCAQLRLAVLRSFGSTSNDTYLSPAVGNSSNAAASAGVVEDGGYVGSDEDGPVAQDSWSSVEPVLGKIHIRNLVSRMTAIVHYAARRRIRRRFLFSSSVCPTRSAAPQPRLCAS